MYFANEEALFRAAIRQELDTALRDVDRCLNEEGVGLQRRVVAALDAWLGRYVGSLLVSDIGEMLRNPAMQLGDLVDAASAAFDERLAAAIADAIPEDDRTRLGVTPEEITGVLHTLAQGAKYLSNARAESSQEFVARVAAAVRVVFAGYHLENERHPQGPDSDRFDDGVVTPHPRTAAW